MIQLYLFKAFRLGLSLLLILSINGIFSLVKASEKSQTDQPKDWSIIASYDIPGKASGLAWDGTYIYFGIYGSNGDQVHRFDPSTGTEELLFTNPSINDAYGMTYDGTNLWITDHGLSSSEPAYALELDFSGSSISQFDLPDHYMSGIAFDEGNFWVATYYPNPGTIYKVDGTGAIITQFQSPDEQPWDVCVEGDYLWIADYDGNMLYKTDQSGNILENHPCENIKPSGVVFDGQYLWYVDGQLSSNSTLYKVDLAGGGTAQINVPVTSYNYGTVSIGDSAVWNCSIENTGTANLEITGLIIQNAVPIFNYTVFPIVIEPGNTDAIEFVFKPTETGSLNTIVTIESSDPVNPETELELEGEAVYSGPHINVAATTHDYGSIRLNANKRWFCTVSNDGSQPLEITGITFDDPAFYIDEMLPFPTTIPVLSSIDFGFWFHPQEVTSYAATAIISHNDPTQDPIEITLSGEAVDIEFPMGDNFWHYQITTSWDNSIKAIAPIEDMNDDGVGEVIVCSEDDFVRCFNGNSHSTADIFWQNEAGTVYGQNGLTTIEDINGDGYRDVVVGMAWGVRSIKVLSGKTGLLLWIYDTHVYGDGGWVYQVWTGYDYNGDGISDVLASTGNDGNNTGPKRIFCLDGTDGSAIWDAYSDGPNFSVIGVADFTGDGIPDVIGGASNNGETEGKVFGINGENGAILWTHTTGGTSVWALEQLDDATGDGIKDVVAGDFGGNYYFLNATNGAVFQSGSMGSSLLLRAERLDDVNGNGYADISFASSSSNAVVIDGLTGTNIWLSSLADKCWNIDRIEDVSGDGINDLIAGTLFSNNNVYFLDGVNGDQLFSQSYGEAIDGLSAIPDINGDGSWEMVAGGREGTLICFSGGINSLTVLADFMADTTFGLVPFDVHFTDLSMGSVNTWEWDFDNDGTIDSFEENPTYTYSLSGIYSVSLSVSDGINSNTLIKEDYITADTAVGISINNEAKSILVAPNPFGNQTTIVIRQDLEFPAILTIFNSSGQLIEELTSESISDGIHALEWNRRDQNGTRVHPGIYYGILTINHTKTTIKLIAK
ncbi:MAG: choice-of-anchor D domain-containing protein [Bacteroidetes bacterium]|nr:choice-of-anchor D domain-containing protein [Bacteroidota bacterium]